jgi:hypothetical protein
LGSRHLFVAVWPQPLSMVSHGALRLVSVLDSETKTEVLQPEKIAFVAGNSWQGTQLRSRFCSDF